MEQKNLIVIAKTTVSLPTGFEGAAFGALVPLAIVVSIAFYKRVIKVIVIASASLTATGTIQEFFGTHRPQTVKSLYVGIAVIHHARHDDRSTGIRWIFDTFAILDLASFLASVTTS